MKKTPIQSNKAQSHDSSEAETYKGKTLKPRDFEVFASSGDDGPPIQRKPNTKAEVSTSVDKSVNDLNRDRIITQSGSAPNPNSPNSKVLYEGSAEFGNVSGSAIEYNGVGFLNGNASASMGGGITKRGAKGNLSAELGGSLINYDNKWNFGPFKVNVFGEQTAVDLALSVKGFLGAEAKLKLEANISKIQSTTDMANISEKNLKYGVEGGVDAFAGVKIELGVAANYEWAKKKKEFYIEKFKQNAGVIIKEAAKINPDLGSWLQELPLEEAENILGGFLYGLGTDGKVNLAEAKAGGWIGYGAGLQANAGLRITKGKFYYHTKMGVAWGLGFGGNVSIGLDLLEGTLFGLAVGGELLPAAIAELKHLISKENLVAVGNMVWERIAFWRKKNQVRKVESPGKNTSSKSNASSKEQSTVSNQAIATQPRAPMCDASYKGPLNNDLLKPIDFSHYPIGVQGQNF